MTDNDEVGNSDSAERKESRTRWPSLKEACSSIIRTIIVAAVGCCLLLLAVPLAQAMVSAHILGTGIEALDRKDDAAKAIEKLSKLEHWTVRFPSVAVRIQAMRARCYYRQGDTSLAYESADKACSTPTERPTPALPTSIQTAKRYIIERPRCLANKIIGWQISKERGDHNSMAGYHGILYEAELTDDPDKMRSSAETLLVKNKGDKKALALLAYLDTPEKKRKSLVRVRAAAGGFATKKRQLTADEIRDRKFRKLNAQKEDVLARIEKYKAYMAGAPVAAPPADQAAYDKANGEYQRAVKDSRAMEKKFANAQGAERMALLDQLHRKKGVVAQLKNKKDRAAAKIGGTKKKVSKNDPQLRKLETELYEINNELDMM